MSLFRKGVKTPEFSFLNHIPALKDGASDLFRVTVTDNYPDIYVGGNNTKTKGIYANLTFSGWAHP
jgi:hypothetical protein